MRIRTLLILSLTLSLALPFFAPLKAKAKEAPGVSATSAILLHPASGAVLFEKNADLRRPIASTTKIVTALTVLRLERDLTRAVTIPANCCGVEGSSLYLKEGETLTLSDLLYGLMLSSANDAAASLAVLTAGSIEAFADRMNETAREAGAINSHFVNPHGLDDPAHYSTARDLALLASKALDDETFRAIVSTKRKTVPAPDGGKRWLINHNKLLNLLPGCVGVKTGFTKKSGRCLVSAAERDGELLVAVTLNAPNDWNDHIALFDYGFESLEKRTLLDVGKLVFDCPVVNGTASTVRVGNREGITISLPAGSEPAREIRLPRFLPAPLEKGEIVGSVEYRLNGKTVGYSPLVACDGVGEIKYKKGLFRR